MFNFFLFYISYLSKTGFHEKAQGLHKGASQSTKNIIIQDKITAKHDHTLTIKNTVLVQQIIKYSTKTVKEHAITLITKVMIKYPTKYSAGER